MAIKHNAVSVGKIGLLAAILLLVGLVSLGCVGEVPRGWSGGTIADGTLFLGSMDGELVAVNASSGARLWEVPFEPPASGGGFGCAPASTAVAIYGTPVVAGDLVYVGGYDGKIYAVSSSTRLSKARFLNENDRQPIVGGPVVASGKVFIGSSDGWLYALDAASLDEEWKFETGDKIWSTPAIEGDTLYVGSFDRKLYAIDITTGREKWEQPFETQGAIATTPVVYNNTVLVGSFDRHLYAVDAANGRQIWQFPAEDEVENKPENWFWAKLVVHNSTIYAGNLDGKIYILNAETGDEVVDAIDLGSPLSSWPVLVDNLVIIASEEGRIYALDTDDNQIKPLADLEEKIYAPLSASDGVIYVHTQGETLEALNAQTGVTLWSLSLSSK